ncbi:MAG: TetR/AcrR family transcriptional regulator [Myxococcales bacterium]|nr:TetR/AcrR family transcriptional regulator [Myxococcales bacterium]MDP3502511.1 TetR/AcrR family transcriptional regulator [Myxococcales bacterium]
MKRAPAKRAIKQDRAVKTRQDILNSAITLFARRGILATTMAELARAIHMTPGALYWHFPTKEDLLLAAIEELHTRFVKSFEPMLNLGAKWTAHQQLKGFVEHTGRFLQDNREHGIFYGMVGAEAAENSADVAQALRDALQVYVLAVANIIKYGQTKTKEFREDVDAMTLANAIIFGNIGLVVQHNLFRDTLSYEPMVQTLSTMVLAGVLKQK